MAIRSGVDMQFYDFAHDVFQKALIDCVNEGRSRRLIWTARCAPCCASSLRLGFSIIPTSIPV